MSNEITRGTLAHRQSCVDLEPEAIAEELVRMPGDYSYWSGMFANAKRQQMLTAGACKRVYAEQDAVQREILAAHHANNTGAKPTEKMVEAAVLTSPEYQDARQAEIEADVAVIDLQGYLEALRMKRDAVLQLSAMRRQEMRSFESMG